MKFAVLDNNIVINLIIADNLKIAENVTKLKCIQYTDHNLVDINWIYDENTDKFINPNTIVNEVNNA